MTIVYDRENNKLMKKAFLYFPFLFLLMTVMVNDSYSQPLTIIPQVKFVNLLFLQNDAIEVVEESGIDENLSKKSSVNKTESGEVKRENSISSLPSSSRLSIGIGKALFEKYIK